MCEESEPRKNIIIVGAGMAGIAAWNELKLHGLDESKYTVTIITPQPYFIHRLGENRAAVTSEGDWDEKSWVPLGEKFNEGNSKLVIGSVVSISEQEDESGSVVLHDGREMPYAYLVLATGSSWGSHLAFPESKSESKAWAANWRAKFENAQNIVIVGGGVIGIGAFLPLMLSSSSYNKIAETAGELKSSYPVRVMETVICFTLIQKLGQESHTRPRSRVSLEQILSVMVATEAHISCRIPWRRAHIQRLRGPERSFI